MRERVFLVILLFLALASYTTAQRGTATVDQIAETGVFNGLLYSNTSLAMEMLAPGGWNVVPKDRNTELVRLNRERALRSGDAMLKEYAQNTQILFQATPPEFAGQQTSALFSAGVQRLVRKTTLDEYLSANRDLVLQTPGSRVLRDIHSVDIGRSRFREFEVEIPQENGTFRQRYLATLRSPYVVFFVITINDDRQLNMIDFSLNSLRFTR
ncbi:MAG: hypothetical protein IPM50_11440 [Acidobacteriota bacterium]|nr:MAG: hypothetical protein IPM50_11440 [Acidobacteriota bacterium]